ncbi:MAG: STAS domain-containing protein [Spirochaetes bacterium]|nr:STAS domain-containing protein [Spirochaetota bacterium]
MEINSRKKGKVVILDISGDITLYNASEIVNTIDKVIENQKYNVVINLKDVSYIDSSGIGAIISCSSRLKKNQSELKIINVYASSVKKVFELTNLTSFFDIYDSEEEAIKSFEH